MFVYVRICYSRRFLDGRIRIVRSARIRIDKIDEINELRGLLEGAFGLRTWLEDKDGERLG